MTDEERRPELESLDRDDHEAGTRRQTRKEEWNRPKVTFTPMRCTAKGTSLTDLSGFADTT